MCPTHRSKNTPYNRTPYERIPKVKPRTINFVKKTVNFVVAIGTGKIISDIIENNTNPETATDKVTYMAGSYALAGLVAHETSSYTDRKIDELVEKLNLVAKEDQPEETTEEALP